MSAGLNNFKKLTTPLKFTDMIDKFVNIALSKVGTREEGGNNKGASIIEFQKATWLKPDAWAWCAAFVCWCLREALTQSPEYLVEMNITDLEKWRCRDASAFGWIKWAKAHGLKVFEYADGIPTDLIKAGDIIVYAFSHIGIASKDQPAIGARIDAIEGNTNASGARDSNTGDAVLAKNRPAKQIKAVIRFEYA